MFLGKEEVPKFRLLVPEAPITMTVAPEVGGKFLRRCWREEGGSGCCHHRSSKSSFLPGYFSGHCCEKLTTFNKILTGGGSDRKIFSLYELLVSVLSVRCVRVD